MFDLISREALWTAVAQPPLWEMVTSISPTSLAENRARSSLLRTRKAAATPPHSKARALLARNVRSHFARSALDCGGAATALGEGHFSLTDIPCRKSCAIFAPANPESGGDAAALQSASVARAKYSISFRAKRFRLRWPQPIRANAGERRRGRQRSVAQT
jgi:hypothetical protein